MNIFFGENLQSLRELNGLSRKELANKVGVTEREIWEYENHNSAPEFGVVKDVKKELSVRAQFLYTKPFRYRISKRNSISYSLDDRNSIEKVEMGMAFVDFTKHFIDKFEEHLFSPLSSISILKEEVSKLCNRRTDFSTECFELEKMAEYVRKKLNVHENKEMLYKLEISGVYILERITDLSIDSYSM